jgi:hypothetical protein
MDELNRFSVKKAVMSHGRLAIVDRLGKPLFGINN